MSPVNLDDPALEARIVVAITRAFARDAPLPEWMKITVLGRDMTPLGELAAPQVIEALRGLIEPEIAEAEKRGAVKAAAHFLRVGQDCLNDFGDSSDAWVETSDVAKRIESGEVTL